MYGYIYFILNKINGRKRSAEARKRMSDSHKGKIPCNKGLCTSKVG